MNNSKERRRRKGIENIEKMLLAEQLSQVWHISLSPFVCVWIYLHCDRLVENTSHCNGFRLKINGQGKRKCSVCVHLTSQFRSVFRFHCFFSFFLLAVDTIWAWVFTLGFRARMFCNARPNEVFYNQIGVFQSHTENDKSSDKDNESRDHSVKFAVWFVGSWW